MSNEAKDSRWEFIEKATKDIDSWTDSEKAEIHPQRALNSTLKNVKSVRRTTNDQIKRDRDRTQEDET